jgi:hypothetical protein
MPVTTTYNCDGPNCPNGHDVSDAKIEATPTLFRIVGGTLWHWNETLGAVAMAQLPDPLCFCSSGCVHDYLVAQGLET